MEGLGESQGIKASPSSCQALVLENARLLRANCSRPAVPLQVHQASVLVIVPSAVQPLTQAISRQQRLLLCLFLITLIITALQHGVTFTEVLCLMYFV